MSVSYTRALAGLVVLVLAATVQAQNFGLQIGIDQTFTDNRWPGAEDPTQAINWVGQKYLNFAGDEFNDDGSNVFSGFMVQPI